MKGTNMFSQNDEEKHIVNFFKGKIDKGRFLEIGAYHPAKFSNTRRLVLNGWTGVYFEPSISLHHAFDHFYGDRDDIILDKRAVGEKNAQVTFYDSCGDAISSFNKKHCDKWKKNWGSKFKEITVEMITFATLFEEYGRDFDFINIDVEATNYQLFQCMNFKNLPRCKLFCIEHDKKNKEIENKLKPFGFRRILQNPENIILGRD